MLLQCWDQPHRYHHARKHLVAVLDVVDAHAGLAVDTDTVRLAAWFHDAVYDPGVLDNEERSASFATDVLG
jgi:predicted metal-dependent HD superfamily phosphohydrolase